jgi:hypothetical protein
VLLGASSSAGAQLRDLAPVANVSALSAHAGWVTWSERQAGGEWRLVLWHDGVRASAPIPPRSVPFDADVGSDAHGRPVVTYSRCAADPHPVAPFTLTQDYVSPNGLPNQATARGCTLRVLSLTTGRESRLHVHRPRGASDTTPSMWRGDVAFARIAKGQTVAQILLWRHRRDRIRRLRHGTVPMGCPYKEGCKGVIRRGSAQQLDLGRDGVAFVWDIQAPAVIGAGDGWELRVDDLRTGASRNYDSGYQSGACGARYPVSPTMVGRDVWFSELRWRCDVLHTSYVRGVVSSRRGLLETGPPVMWQLAVDGTTAYSIRGPRPPSPEAAPSNDAPCSGTYGPCRLVAEPLPDLAATGRPAEGPVFEG